MWPMDFTQGSFHIDNPLHAYQNVYQRTLHRPATALVNRHVVHVAAVLHASALLQTPSHTAGTGSCVMGGKRGGRRYLIYRAKHGNTGVLLGVQLEKCRLHQRYAWAVFSHHATRSCRGAGGAPVCCDTAAVVGRVAQLVAHSGWVLCKMAFQSRGQGGEKLQMHFLNSNRVRGDHENFIWYSIPGSSSTFVTYPASAIWANK